MAKKDPYKKIQKRFVEARAAGQGLEYEDLSVEQRERFQNRFNTLAQTVEGRGKIAQRLLGPDAPQEQRRGLRQRIKQNLPGETLPDAGGDQTGPTNNTKQLTMRDFRRAEMQTSSYQPAAPTRRFQNTNPRKGEVTTRVTATTQDRGSDRIGKGFFSIPKSPLQALKEVGRGAMDIVDYTNRAYINPVINVAGKTSEKLGGGKWKPLPELSKKEITIESALTVGTGIGGLVTAPIRGAAARTAAQVGGAVGRRVSPTIGAALAQPGQRAVARQVALQQVKQQAQRQALGQQIVSRYADVMSDVVPSRVTPPASGVKRTTPASSGKFAKTTVEKAPKAEVTPKPKRASKPKVTQTKISKADQPFLEDLSVEQRGNIYDVAPVERVTAKPTKTKTKQKISSPEMVEAELRGMTETVKAAEESAPKRQWWKEETIPKSQREFLEDLSAEQRTDIYDVAPRKERKAKPTSVKKVEQKPLPAQVDNAMEAMEIPASPRTEAPLPKPKRVSQKKSKVTEVAKPQQVSAEITAEEADILRSYPSSARAQEIYRRQKGIKEFELSTGERMEIKPVKNLNLQVRPSKADELFQAINQPKPKEPLGFTPRKVTKLPKRDNPAMDKLESEGSMLYRMYDKGIGSKKRPGGIAGEMNTGVSAESQLDDVVDAMRGGTMQGTASDVKMAQKEVERTIVVPEAKIRRGESINPRYRRRAQQTAQGEMPMPTTMSKGEMEFKPTQMPTSTEVGKSSEQRLAEYYRSLYPQAKSNAQARKMYAKDRGLDPSTLKPQAIGSPLGARASRTPVTEMEVSRPVKFEEVTSIVGGKRVTVKKPTKFVTETVPAVETLFGTVPVEEMRNPVSQRWINSAETIRGKKLQAKANKMRTEATRAAELRNRGLAGEARGQQFQKVKQATEEGKAFQVRFDEMLNKPASPTGPVKSKKKGKKK